MKPPATAVAPATPIRAALQPQAAPAAPQSTVVGQDLQGSVGIARALPLPQLPAAGAPPTYLAQPHVNAFGHTAPIAPQAPAASGPEDSGPGAPPDRSIGVGQVICWQLALVAVGLATTSTRLVLGITTAVAILVIIATSVRVRGTWLYGWAGVLAAFVCRRRRRDLSSDAGLGLVALFCGKTTASTLMIREQAFGMLSRADAAGVVLRPGPDAHRELFRRLGPLLEATEEQPVNVSVQLVLHTGVRQDRSIRAWVAVTARRTPEICTDEQLGQVLANTARRLLRRLDRDGLETVALDESAVLASIGALAHANAGRGHLRESWTTWSAGPVRQVCVRLTGFAALPVATAQALIDTLLGTVTGSAQTIAVTVASTGPYDPGPYDPGPHHSGPYDSGAYDSGPHVPGPYGSAPGDAGPDGLAKSTATIRYDAVLRVAAAHPATLDSALTVLGALARSYGVEPERLDGRHAGGVAATLPLGVCLR